MPILNYTTTVEAEKSAAEIIAKLGAKGASRITQEYANAKIVGIGFVYDIGGMPVYFKLPANEDGVERYLIGRSKGAYSSSKRAAIKAQARRVAWRILKDWIEAQIAFVESSQAEMGQVFMPYAETPSGETMYQLFLNNNQQLALGSGEK